MKLNTHENYSNIEVMKGQKNLAKAWAKAHYAKRLYSECESRTTEHLDELISQFPCNIFMVNSRVYPFADETDDGKEAPSDKENLPDKTQTQIDCDTTNKALPLEQERYYELENTAAKKVKLEPTYFSCDVCQSRTYSSQSMNSHLLEEHHLSASCYSSDGAQCTLLALRQLSPDVPIYTKLNSSIVLCPYCFLPFYDLHSCAVHSLYHQQSSVGVFLLGTLVDLAEVKMQNSALRCACCSECFDRPKEFNQHFQYSKYTCFPLHLADKYSNEKGPFRIVLWKWCRTCNLQFHRTQSFAKIPARHSDRHQFNGLLATWTSFRRVCCASPHFQWRMILVEGNIPDKIRSHDFSQLVSSDSCRRLLLEEEHIVLSHLAQFDRPGKGAMAFSRTNIENLSDSVS